MEDKLLDILEKIASAGFSYVKDQVGWQKRTKEPLARLKGYLPHIQAVVHFASSQEQITEQNLPLNKWLWQLRDAIDDAYDVVDELEYIELGKQVTKDKKLRSDWRKRLVKIGKRALQIDPTLKRLEDAVQKLDTVSTNVASFIYLVKDAKQEHQKKQLELHGARETGSSPKNDLIGRGKEKELIMEWLRNPSNEHRGTDLYRNISLLSIVGHGDMLECLKEERPRLETLEALQGRLEEEVMSKKFLLVLDDIWDEDEEKDKCKWEDVLAPSSLWGFW